VNDTDLPKNDKMSLIISKIYIFYGQRISTHVDMFSVLAVMSCFDVY